MISCADYLRFKIQILENPYRECLQTNKCKQNLKQEKKEGNTLLCWVKAGYIIQETSN